MKRFLRMAGAIITGNPPLGVLRIHRWLSAWTRHDPPEPHTYRGPLTVSTAWRQQGTARRLMLQACQQLEALGEVIWLETDLAINAAFYETLGFVVDREEAVLSASNWFMRREPGRTGLPQMYDEK